MNIHLLHLIPTLGYGGAERQLTLLAAAQRRRGHDVHVGVLRGGANETRLAEAGVPVHRLRARGHHDPLLALSALRLARRLRPDVVQTWLPLMDVTGAVVTRLAGTPWVLTERSSLAAYRRLKDRALRLPLGRFADAVVANSEAGADMWRRQTGRPARIVRNVVPADEIGRVAPASRSELTLPEDAKVVLFVGRLSAEKSIELLLAALTRVVSEQRVYALVCGSGPLLPLVESAVEATGGRIRYLGERDDPWRLMKMANLLVAPSQFEGNPTVVLEAAACGCPLLLSDIPSHREILTEDSAAFFPLGDPATLAAAIDRLLASPDEAAALASGARRALGEWTIRGAVAAYDEVYEGALEGRR